jgi:hypothetical protein
MHHTARAVAAAVVIGVIGLGGCGEPTSGTRASPGPTSTEPSSTDVWPPETAPLGPCPASGAGVAADVTDGSLGARHVGLWLTNCGSTTFEVNGYPELVVLDEEERPLDVVVLHGMEMGSGADVGPVPMVLAPGQSAVAVLSWRNTAVDERSVEGTHIAVTAVPGIARQTVPLYTDLGTTGQVKVTGWRAPVAPSPDDESVPPPTDWDPPSTEPDPAPPPIERTRFAGRGAAAVRAHLVLAGPDEERCRSARRGTAERALRFPGSPRVS